MTDEQAKRLFEAFPESPGLYVLRCKRCGHLRSVALAVGESPEQVTARFAHQHVCKPKTPRKP
jgi:hypothetical protein